MPQVIVADKARQGINRCLTFLRNNAASDIISDVKHEIADSLDSLEKGLLTGFPVEDDEDELLYEVIIPYGESGYAYCYFIDVRGCCVISGFKHQKEKDYY